MTSIETGVTLRARWPAACCRRSMTSTWSRTVWLSFGLPVLANSSQAFARPLRVNHMLRLQTDRHRVEAANAPPEHPLRSVTSITPYVGQDQLWGRSGPALGPVRTSSGAGQDQLWGACMPTGCWTALEVAQEQLKLIIRTHIVVLSAGVTQKATSVSDVTGHGGFNVGLSLLSTQSGDSEHSARVHFGSPTMPQT